MRSSRTTTRAPTAISTQEEAQRDRKKRARGPVRLTATELAPTIGDLFRCKYNFFSSSFPTSSSFDIYFTHDDRERDPWPFLSSRTFTITTKNGLPTDRARNGFQFVTLKRSRVGGSSRESRRMKRKEKKSVWGEERERRKLLLYFLFFFLCCWIISRCFMIR